MLSGTSKRSETGRPPFAISRQLRDGCGHPYVGMWMTEDSYIRHELLPNGRYDEARGNRESAYCGRYEVTGNHIEYRDNTGFTADGDFVTAYCITPE